MRRVHQGLGMFMAAALAASGIAPAATIAPPRPASAEGAQRAVLTLKINGLDCGQVFVALQGQDVLVKMSDLTDHGVRGEAGTAVHLPYGDYVSLSSLIP